MKNEKQNTSKKDHRLTTFRLRELIKELELEKKEETQTIVIRLLKDDESSVSFILNK